VSSAHRPRRQHVGRMGVGARAARETHIGGAVAVRERRATPTPRVLDLSSMLDARACVEHEPCEAARSKSVRVAVASSVHASRNTARGTGRVVLARGRLITFFDLLIVERSHVPVVAGPPLSPFGVPPSGVQAIRARLARARENRRDNASSTTQTERSCLRCGPARGRALDHAAASGACRAGGAWHDPVAELPVLVPEGDYQGQGGARVHAGYRRRRRAGEGPAA